jgi:hypothetical protein
MLSEGQKRRASINVLEQLRNKGMPEKGRDEFDSMFAAVDEEGNVVPGGEEEEMPPEGKPVDEKEKKKLDKKKVEQFTKGFKSVF